MSFSLTKVPDGKKQVYKQEVREENASLLLTCIKISLVVMILFLLQALFLPTASDSTYNGLLSYQANAILYSIFIFITFIFWVIFNAPKQVKEYSGVQFTFVVYIIVWVSFITVYDLNYDRDYSAYCFGILSVLYFYRAEYREYLQLTIFALVFSLVSYLLIYGQESEASLFAPLFVFSIAIVILSQKFEELRIKNFLLRSEVDAKNQELADLSVRDGLTQLYNRRYFNQRLDEEWSRLGRAKLPLSIVMCDIDHFKQFNDIAGHPAGDRCLQKIAEAIRISARRASDFSAKYGGEEFVVVLPQANEHSAKEVAEIVMKNIAELAIEHPAHPGQSVTISVGISTMIPDERMPSEQIVSLADKALYQSKTNGRNRITIINQ